MIKEGDHMPDGKLYTKTEKGVEALSAKDIFDGKTVVLFGLPGAFTPTCSARHLPGFVDNADQLKQKGVDTIACLSVNDAFVMDAWAKDQHVNGKVLMLADGNGDYSEKLGLTMDGTGFGMGKRANRYAMVVKNGVVKKLNLEAPGAFEVSSAESIMKAL